MDDSFPFSLFTFVCGGVLCSHLAHWCSPLPLSLMILIECEFYFLLLSIWKLVELENMFIRFVRI